MKTAKLILILLLGTFSLSGCGLYKKVFKSEKTEKSEQIRRDSTFVSNIHVDRTRPTESVFEMRMEDLFNAADFLQKIDAGKGNESTVQKKDGRLTVRTTTGESVSTTETEKSDVKEETLISERIISEMRTVVKKLPWWVWVGLAVWLLSKVITILTPILALFFPGSGIINKVATIVSRKK